MPNGQDTHFIPQCHESIQSYITRLSVRNNQLTQLTLDMAAKKWMRPEVIGRRLDCWILVAQKLEDDLDMI